MDLGGAPLPPRAHRYPEEALPAPSIPGTRTDSYADHFGCDAIGRLVLVPLMPYLCGRLAAHRDAAGNEQAPTWPKSAVCTLPAGTVGTHQMHHDRPLAPWRTMHNRAVGAVGAPRLRTERAAAGTA